MFSLEQLNEVEEELKKKVKLQCWYSCHCAWQIREGTYSKLSYRCYTHFSWRLMGFEQDICELSQPNSIFMDGYFKVSACMGGFTTWC